MMENALDHAIRRQLQAIDLCLETGCELQALTLIYTGIDAMAWLAMPAERDEVTRQDFLGWCARYMPEDFQRRCRPIDLYAARCSISHGYSTRSRLSRSAAAREIVYRRERSSGMEKSARDESVIVGLDELRGAFARALDAFRADAASDARLAARAAARFTQSAQTVLSRL